MSRPFRCSAGSVSFLSRTPSRIEQRGPPSSPDRAKGRGGPLPAGPRGFVTRDGPAAYRSTSGQIRPLGGRHWVPRRLPFDVSPKDKRLSQDGDTERDVWVGINVVFSKRTFQVRQDIRTGKLLSGVAPLHGARPLDSRPKGASMSDHQVTSAFTESPAITYMTTYAVHPSGWWKASHGTWYPAQIGEVSRQSRRAAE